MAFNEVVTITILIFVVTFCLYSIVDRVCQCAEKCSFLKNAGEHSKNCDKKTDNLE